MPGRRPWRRIRGPVGLVDGDCWVQVVPFQVQVSLEDAAGAGSRRRAPAGRCPGRRPWRRRTGPGGSWPGSAGSRWCRSRSRCRRGRCGRCASRPAEEHQLAGGRVVGHRRVAAGGGAGGRGLLRPGGAVPGPGVVLAWRRRAPEEHDLPVAGVVGHGGAVAGRWAGGRGLLGPGGAVPGPGVVQGRRSVAGPPKSTSWPVLGS